MKKFHGCLQASVALFTAIAFCGCASIVSGWFILSSNLNAGWYLLGNLFIGGLIGWLIVDPATGAMYTLSSDTVNAQLASETSFLRQKEGLMIVLLKDVPAAVLPQLQKVALQD